MNDLKETITSYLAKGNIIKARAVFLDAYRMKRHIISEMEFISLHEYIYNTYGAVL